MATNNLGSTMCYLNAPSKIDFEAVSDESGLGRSSLLQLIIALGLHRQAVDTLREMASKPVHEIPADMVRYVAKLSR